MVRTTAVEVLAPDPDPPRPSFVIVKSSRHRSHPSPSVRRCRSSRFAWTVGSIVILMCWASAVSGFLYLTDTIDSNHTRPWVETRGNPASSLDALVLCVATFAGVPCVAAFLCWRCE